MKPEGVVDRIIISMNQYVCQRKITPQAMALILLLCNDNSFFTNFKPSGGYL
jgi:hypothetical protein